MTPTFQTINGFGGNCFQACIASILEKPIEDIPHFFAEATPENQIWTQAQWAAVQAFAAANNCQACWLDPQNENDKHFVQLLIDSGLYYIAFGDSVAGNFGHCVVARSGEFIHDPAGRAFLASDPWLYVLLEPEKGSAA